MRALAIIVFILILASCSSTPPTTSSERAPAQSAGPAKTSTGHPAHVDASAFEANEIVPRQHSFIFPDPEARFGYHVTQFRANHQHQFIVRGRLIAVQNNAKEQQNLKALSTKIAAPLTRDGEYFSVTSDMPRFLLRELISGQRKDFLVDVYDGLIISKPVKVIQRNARYQIEEKIYDSPMYADDKRLSNAQYIVFGYSGAPTKRLYLAHVIKAANNYEQLLAVDFDQPMEITNGVVIELNKKDSEDNKLKRGETLSANVAGKQVNFTVQREIYFDKRTAEGFPDGY
jgi:hypothetical protein